MSCGSQVKLTKFVLFWQNLDVNLAVNNLLSRDDVEGDEEDTEGDPYLAGEKITMSFLSCTQTDTIFVYSDFIARLAKINMMCLL